MSKKVGFPEGGMVDLTRTLVEQIVDQILENAREFDGDDRVTYAGNAGAEIFQEVLIQIALRAHHPGTREGAVWLSKMYTQAFKETYRRWLQEREGSPLH